MYDEVVVRPVVRQRSRLWTQSGDGLSSESAPDPSGSLAPMEVQLRGVIIAGDRQRAVLERSKSRAGKGFWMATIPTAGATRRMRWCCAPNDFWSEGDSYGLDKG